MLCRVLIMRLCCHGAMWGAASAAERTVVELWLDWAEVVAVPRPGLSRILLWLLRGELQALCGALHVCATIGGVWRLMLHECWS